MVESPPGDCRIFKNEQWQEMDSWEPFSKVYLMFAEKGLVSCHWTSTWVRSAQLRKRLCPANLSEAPNVVTKHSAMRTYVETVPQVKAP